MVGTAHPTTKNVLLQLVQDVSLGFAVTHHHHKMLEVKTIGAVLSLLTHPTKTRRSLTMNIGVNLSYRWLIVWLTHPPRNEFHGLLAKVY